MSALNSTKTPDLAKITYLLLSTVAVVMILYYTEEYVIPFIVAMLIWFIIHEAREYLVRIPYIRNKVPVWLQSTFSFLVMNVILFVVGKLLYTSMSNLSENLEEYQTNLVQAMQELNGLVGVDVASHMTNYVKNSDFTQFIGMMIDTATTLFGDAFLILIYLIFLLVEETVFDKKMEAFYPSDSIRKKKFALLNKMDRNIGRYLLLKTFVSFITGLLSYAVLFFLNIDSPFFWAMMIFVLNYIPTVGSLIATLFPAFFAILQFGELAPFGYVLVSVGVIQVIVGNIIEPKMMGNSLNMSSLVVILSLTIWGAIWGVMGMILSVPITVMMIIVCEEIPSLKFVAVALSENGELSTDYTQAELEDHPIV
ncbi:AI-2E family transporter [Reichenbachiella carrageenanivorans]|uniref:AI-2E family transporter n=1 Tax=Reichenbachiella carrageenanivorans TaxID=2979869 RepID=A0ABY6D4J8_9BACT|nr:AI-2E family transporter [Reichenbachiella carrageenanivorans]UXX81067.1 AI-2E family transporter [Reichenbachiella carrageenanivorans]